MPTHTSSLSVPFSSLIPPIACGLPSRTLIEDIEVEGLIEPLLCHATKEGWHILSGGRRWAALVFLREKGSKMFEEVEIVAI